LRIDSEIHCEGTHPAACSLWSGNG